MKLSCLFSSQRLSQRISSGITCTANLTKMEGFGHIERKISDQVDSATSALDENNLSRRDNQEKLSMSAAGAALNLSSVKSENSEEISFSSPHTSKQRTTQKSPGFGTASKRPAPRKSFTPEKAQKWAMDLLTRSQTYCHKFVDSHCHIDLIYDRLELPKTTGYAEFRETNAKYFPANYEGCVAIFCHPDTFDLHSPQDAVLKTVSEEPGVWLALGCHPKNATSFKLSSLDGLRKMLKSSSKVVALGEIGLDYSGEFYKLADVQREVLVKQLHLAVKLSLPLVIHCRDADEELLEILKEHVPREHMIHRHCFTQDLSTAERWMDMFPNMYIGFTPVITYKSAAAPAMAASRIPLNRLLLETDAPYFVPGMVIDRKIKITHPGFALFTAEKIAELRGISVDDVLEACRRNTSSMYGI